MKLLRTTAKRRNAPKKLNAEENAILSTTVNNGVKTAQFLVVNEETEEAYTIELTKEELLDALKYFE